MRYYVPKLIAGWLSPAQTGPQDKFGGLPWGMPVKYWPRCAACGNPQSLVAQLYHSERLNLGGAGRVLYAFQCGNWYENESPCDPFTVGSNCTACFILEAKDQSPGLTQSPAPTKLHIESRIEKWIEFEDGIEESQAGAYLNYDAWMKLEHKNRASPSSETKIGSVPYWMYQPIPLPQPDSQWRFLMQISEFMSFEGQPPDANVAGCRIVTQRNVIENGQVVKVGVTSVIEPDKISPNAPDAIIHEIDQKEWSYSFANFSMGWGYVFIKKNSLQGLFVVSR